MRFPDAPSLTADSSPTTAAALRAMGVLQYSEGLAAKVDAGQELPAGGSDGSPACVCL